MTMSQVTNVMKCGIVRVSHYQSEKKIHERKDEVLFGLFQSNLKFLQAFTKGSIFFKSTCWISLFVVWWRLFQAMKKFISLNFRDR